MTDKYKGKVYLPPNWQSAPCGTDGKLCRKCVDKAQHKEEKK